MNKNREKSDKHQHRHAQFFSNKINELKKAKYKTVDTKKRKVVVNNATSDSFNEQIEELDNERIKLSNAEKHECCTRYNFTDLFADVYDYSDLFLPPLECDEKVPYRRWS